MSLKIQTCGNVHSEGDTVMNKEGYPNCFTASIRNRWHHCQYPVQNSLQSNDCKGVYLCFRPDSTAPKLVKNVSLLYGSWKNHSIGLRVLLNLLLKNFNNEIVSHETTLSLIVEVYLSRLIIYES